MGQVDATTKDFSSVGWLDVRTVDGPGPQATLLAGATRVPLDISGPDHTFAVGIPRGSPVSLELARAGFAQSMDLRSAKRVGAGVELDLALFEELIAQAATKPADRVRLFEAALALVRGEPLAHQSSPGVDQQVHHMVATIEAVAHQAANDALQEGDALRAESAISRGLLACPSSPLLWEDRLLAAARGSGYGLEQAWRAAHRCWEPTPCSSKPPTGDSNTSRSEPAPSVVVLVCMGRACAPDLDRNLDSRKKSHGRLELSVKAAFVANMLVRTRVATLHNGSCKVVQGVRPSTNLRDRTADPPPCLLPKDNPPQHTSDMPRGLHPPRRPERPESRNRCPSVDPHLPRRLRRRAIRSSDATGWLKFPLQGQVPGCMAVAFDGAGATGSRAKAAAHGVPRRRAHDVMGE